MQKGIRWLIMIIVLVLAGFGVYRYLGSASGLIPSADSAASKGYSAVFLSNDQVYFGKVSVAGNVVVLKDVYYIRLNQAQPQIDKNSDSTDNSQNPQLSLVKLGDQIHGPADEMRINKDQILFVERITDSSTVVKAIDQDKAKRAAGDSTTPLNNDQSSQSSNQSSTSQ